MFTPIRKLEYLGDGNVWMKDESCRAVNPTGTIKDRRISSIFNYLVANKTIPNVVACITSGSIGISVSHHLRVLSKANDVKAVVILGDSQYSRSILTPLIQKVDVSVIYNDLETYISKSKFESIIKKIATGELVDVSDSFHRDNCLIKKLSSHAYEKVAVELVAQLRGELECANDFSDVAIYVPVGCGDFVIGLVNGFAECRVAPKIIGTCIEAENPLPLALKTGDSKVVLGRLTPISLARGLATQATGYLKELCELFSAPSNRLVTITADELNMGVFQHPASSLTEPTGLAAFIACEKTLPTSSALHHVVINTGRSDAAILEEKHGTAAPFDSRLFPGNSR